jgi:tetratricopeptide (TPR) repeat protein
VEVLNKEKVLEHAKQLIDEGKIDKAIAEYRKLLAIDPKDMRIKIRIAELLIRLKKVHEAVKVYKEIANSYTDDGFYLKAVTIYKNILRINPSLIDINYALAELYERMGLNKDAIHQYQILASSLEHKGDYESLIGVRKKMTDIDPHNIAARVRLAETYQYQGQEEDSINEYEMLVDEVRSSGTPEQLIDLYEKILSYRPDNLEMLRSLCKIYYQQGEWKRVVVHLDKAKSLVVDQPDLILMQADVYSRLNQIETAKTKYEDAAAIFIESGDLPRALDAYRDILVIAPDREDEVKELIDEIDSDLFEKIKSKADEKRRELEEREALAEKEAEEEVSEAEAEPKAQEEVRTALSLSDKEISRLLHDADAAFELGKAYRQMGLKKEAEPELSKSLDLYDKLVESGFSSDTVTINTSKAREWLGLTESAAKVEAPKVTEDQKIDENQKADGEIKAKDIKKKTKAPEKASEKKDKKKKEEEKPKKKRDKRMGFV